MRQYGSEPPVMLGGGRLIVIDVQQSADADNLPINAQPFVILFLIIAENRNYWKSIATEISKT